MGLLFESLGILPSAEVYQCSAADFSTGFVGQAARKTREEFEKARGAVLFVDEAYRLYDPTGRSYFQEACDEIVNILTEDDFRGKMVVIFAGYPEPMRMMLNNVNPGFKSRVTEVIEFPDFDADATAQLVLLRLKEKRRDVADEAIGALPSLAARLAAAPQWANGRDVETWVKRITSECAKRGIPQVTTEILEDTVNLILRQKVSDAQKQAASMQTAVVEDDAQVMVEGATPFTSRIESLTLTDEDVDVEDVEPEYAPSASVSAALEEACVALGYDETTDSRELLVSQLAVDHIPDDVVAYVAAKLHMASKSAVVDALRPEIPTVLAGMKGKIRYDREREIELSLMEETQRKKEVEREKAVQKKLTRMGVCPAGFTWHREGCGWRCDGGSHFVRDDDPRLGG